MLKIKELCGSWSKSTGVERDGIGQACVAAAIELCCALHKNKDVVEVEQACRVLSYPLANSSKMDEASSLELLESFGFVLPMLADEFPLANMESIAKCCTHFCQGTAQQAMTRSKLEGKVEAIHRIVKVMEMVLESRIIGIIRLSLTAEQAHQLINYSIDAALAISSKLDSVSAGTGASSSSSSSSSSDHSSKSNKNLNDVASNLRASALSLAADTDCSYRPARCIDQLTRHLVNMNKATKSGSSTILKLIHDVDVFVGELAKRAISQISTSKKTVNKLLDLKDIIRVVLWASECSVIYSDILKSRNPLNKLDLRPFITLGLSFSESAASLEALIDLENNMALGKVSSDTIWAGARVISNLCERTKCHSEIISDVAFLDMLSRVSLMTLQAELLGLNQTTDHAGRSPSVASIGSITKLLNAIYLNGIDAEKDRQAALVSRGTLLGRVLAKLHVDSLNAISACLKNGQQSCLSSWQLAAEMVSETLHSTHEIEFAKYALPVIAISFRAGGNCLALIPVSHLINLCEDLNVKAGIYRLFETLSKCVKILGCQLRTFNDNAVATDVISAVQNLAQLLCSRTANHPASAAPSVELMFALLTLPFKDQKDQCKNEQRGRLMQLCITNCVRGLIVPATSTNSSVAVLGRVSIIERCKSLFVVHEIGTGKASELPHQALSEMRSEFLVGFVSELAFRATDLVACGGDVVQVCIQLLQACSESYPQAVRATIELFVISHWHWARGVGASSPECQSVIEALKSLSVQLNPNLAPRIAAISGTIKRKDRQQEGHQGSSSSSSSLAPQLTEKIAPILHMALQIRVSLLLASWSLPLTASREDARVSDGTQGAAVYMSSALKALRTAGDICEAEPSESQLDTETLMLSMNSLLCDGRNLFFLLELHGRLQDQSKFPGMFARLGSNSTRLGSISAAIRRTTSEFSLIVGMQRCYCNFPTGASVEVDSTCPDDPDWFIKTRNMLSKLSSSEFSTSLPKQHNLQVFIELETSAEAILASVSFKTGGSSPLVLQALRSWICLLVSKAKLLGAGDHRSAFAWARRALSAATQSVSGTPSSTSIATKSSIETTLPRLEAVILTAEIYEMSGNLDSALSYISEAVAMAKLGSRALASLVSLHSLRVWHRTGSLRLVSCLQDLLSVDEFSLQDANDDVTKACRAVAEILGPLIADEDDDRIVTPSIEEVEAKLSFRHTHRCWDLECLISASNAKSWNDNAQPKECLTGNSNRNGYNTILLPHVRRQLRIEELVSNEKRILLSATFEAQISSHAKAFEPITHLSLHPETQVQIQLLSQVSQGVCFDVVRDLRRRCCLQMLGSDFKAKTGEIHHWASRSILAFALGAASCGVALECGIDSNQLPSSSNNTSTSSSLHSTVSDALLSSSILVRSACAADPVALRKLQLTLQQSLLRMNSNSSTLNGKNTAGTMIFAALESKSGNLMLGRLGATNSTPLVVSLPVSSSVEKLLQQWSKVMESSKSALQKTMCIDAVKKWGEKEKKSWWAARQQDDDTIGRLVGDLQDLLGPWRCLLRAESSSALKPAAIPTTSIPASISNWVEVIVSATEIPEPGALTREEAMEALTFVAGGDVTAAKQLFDAHRSHFCNPGSGYSLGGPTPNDAAIFGCAEAKGGEDSEVDRLAEELNGLKVTELRRRLKDMGKPGDGLKKDLVARLLSVEKGSCEEKRGEVWSGNALTAPHGVGDILQTRAERGHLVLLLDETLQNLPWECMPMLRQEQCSRIPGLALMLAMNERGSNSISADPLIHLNKTWFAVDPEGNLPDTRKTMEAFLSPYASRWSWPGVVGSIPPEQVIRTNHEESDLFIYCGHGAGEKLCDARRLRKCCAPAALLWGCSSGRLNAMGVHDPAGMAINYLVAGAPFVLANLWDVTDKDIDKLSISCMETVLGSGTRNSENISNSQSSVMHIHTTVGSALCGARVACKLAHAVGCAPVLYGMPRPVVS